MAAAPPPLAMSLFHHEMIIKLNKIVTYTKSSVNTGISYHNKDTLLQCKHMIFINSVFWLKSKSTMNYLAVGFELNLTGTMLLQAWQ